jgi:hypothetical protein
VAKPSEAGNGGLGVSPDYDITQLARAQKKSKRSGQAQRIREVRGYPRLRHNKARPRAGKIQAAVKLSAAENGGSGVSTYYDNPTRTLAEKGRAERSG